MKGTAPIFLGAQGRAGQVIHDQGGASVRRSVDATGATAGCAAAPDRGGGGEAAMPKEPSWRADVSPLVTPARLDAMMAANSGTPSTSHDNGSD